MRHLYILLLASALLSISSCQNETKPSGPALVYVLRVSYPDLLLRLSDHSTDSTFRRAAHIAKVAMDTGSNAGYLTSFARAYHDIAPSRHLSSIFAYVPRYQRQLTPQSKDEEVIAVLRRSFDESMDQSAAIIAKRFEVKVPPITWRDVLKRRLPKVQVPYSGEVKTRVLKGKGLIEVSVTGADNPDRIKKMVVARGDMGLWETYENEEIFPALMRADQALISLLDLPRPKTIKEKRAETSSFFKDAVVLDKSDTQPAPPAKEEEQKEKTLNPLFALLAPTIDGANQLLAGPAIGMARGKDTATINLYLSLVRKLLPADLRLMWSLRPLGDDDVYQLYAIRMHPGQEAAPISSGMITDAKEVPDHNGSPSVYITMSSFARARWRTMTEAAANGTINGREAHRCIAITLDDRVVSAPRVLGVITGGNTEISGIATAEEAIDLADVLRNGPLPAPLLIVEERIDPAPAAGSK